MYKFQKNQTPKIFNNVLKSLPINILQLTLNTFSLSSTKYFCETNEDLE